MGAPKFADTLAVWRDHWEKSARPRALADLAGTAGKATMDTPFDFTIKADKATIDGASIVGISFAKPHQPAGYLQITDTFAVTTMTRPNWLHRTAMRLLLGWVWKENTRV